MRIERNVVRLSQLDDRLELKASINIIGQKIHARHRKINSSFSLEASNDIKCVHGIDMMSMMISELQNEMTTEMDNEILNTILNRKALVIKREFVYHS
jgi:hypothetical protein